MNRWIWFFVCGVLGLVMIAGGLRVPAHLRAVDAGVIAQAGRNTRALSDNGTKLITERKLGAAQLLLQAAQKGKNPGLEKFEAAVKNLESQYPGARFGPFTDFVVRLENREKTLEHLLGSPQPGVQELLRCRTLTKTALFPPSQSSSGQAFDAALSICGLLLEEARFTTGLSNAVVAAASTANRTGNSQPLEQILMDLMSLGQRFNWDQLTAFVEKIDDAETLRVQANLVRRADRQLPTLFSAVQLSGQPAAVTKYLTTFGETGLNDISASLRFGAGGLSELLRRNLRLHYSTYGKPILLDFSLRTPGFALTVKWLLYLVGGFLIALALHFAKPLPAWEQPLQVRGFHIAREILFALGFLLVVLLVSEPFLAQDSQKVEFPFRLRLPTAGGAVAAEIASVKPSIMNQLSLLTLFLFFVLQALIYTACLFKLAEIRRQNLSSRLKLKLLENEEHLFDAGLYLGFAGTIISLILVSLGVIKPSLMAAYSSTSFGIIFVSVFKIFHLRPLRRQLLLEAENVSPEATRPAPAHSLAAPL